MFNKEISCKIIEKIKKSCSNSDEHHQVLSGLILKNTLAPIQAYYLNDEQHSSLTLVFKTSPPPPDRYNINIPAILAWSYDLRVKKIKEARGDYIPLEKFTHF